ncbi:hypothetical protein KL918_005140 [Ogataea parapolymorpha]|uniref:Tubulin-specific chaperone A n=1 Tax=Ogataea parapolymorpha (strain ATCC 26012 / BCRC 20466 / JCM 22074 / NRRL Y-7560 / DL-1) TaxID=871575 RepID=W1QBM5_OGAPD|nr:hypothetical protein HPODL_04044 [Ogataea parapolymorpha DL-1]ESW98417.1 hypothetical protein HPODL_04044 [Ogataea parapolymorpha DL-1]KAG7864819.1 hypothetical protein KL918_005140 [Ogataea parapolymorpha]KAG7873323.1 hypothetical protein KL916_002272 [Ogataea parapolymorpha]KAG7886365.1 hypothetical protein KL938_000018 [Ogataea parapolymorpha]
MVSTIQIKSNALQRLLKDKKLYKEELREHEDTVADLQGKLKIDESNEELQYTLKNAIKIKDETQRLILNVNGKVREVLQDLKEYVGSHPGESSDAIKKLIIEADKEARL